MRRGDIWLFDLEPIQGSEAGKVRPVIVVSNDGANISAMRTGGGVVTVIPVTSNVTHVLSFQVTLDPGQTGLRAVSKAQTEQVRSVSVTRARTRVGGVRDSDMARIEAALRTHLAL
jgi:mRNA interferase MazF